MGRGKSIDWDFLESVVADASDEVKANASKPKKETYAAEDTSADKFILPYNFIPLGRAKTSGKEEMGNISGKLEIEITTKTPLIIPNTTNEEYFDESKRVAEHRSYDFYSYESLKGKKNDGTLYSPVIPGSEIRGCIRAIHEAMNNSCVSMLDRDENVFLRVQASRDEAGRMVPVVLEINGNDWKVYSANEYKIKDKLQIVRHSIPSDLSSVTLTSDMVLYAGEKYRFNMDGKMVNISRYGELEGILRIGNKTIGKTSTNVCSLFVKKSLIRSLNEKEKKALIRTLQDSSDERINHKLSEGHTGYKNIDLKKDNVEYPLFKDSKSNEFIRLCPSKLGKIASRNNVGDFFRNYEPCEDFENLCKTCEIFGFAGANNATSSRVRFSDATTETAPKDCYNPKVTLKPLLSPHISNEYYHCNRANIDLDHPSHANGRKFYWNFFPSNYQDSPSNLNNTVRPVKEGITFKGTVYYENLTQEQLDDLIRAIELFDEEHYQKIGHAKALGFGSIVIKITNRIDRAISLEGDKVSYNETSKSAFVKYDDKNETMNQIKLMTDGKFLENNKNVCYPSLDWYSKKQKTVRFVSLEDKIQETGILAFDVYNKEPQ